MIKVGDKLWHENYGFGMVVGLAFETIIVRVGNGLINNPTDVQYMKCGQNECDKCPIRFTCFTTKLNIYGRQAE